MMIPLINLTAHSLTPEQIAAAEANGWTVVEAAEVLSPKTLEMLRQSPDDPETLRQLALAIDCEIDFWREGEKYLHLPAGRG